MIESPVKELVQLYRAADSIEAHLICNRLLDNNIHAQVVGAALESAAGGIPVGACTTASVHIDIHDVEAAREVLGWNPAPKPKARPVQFGISALVRLQLILAVAFALFAVFNPTFQMAYMVVLFSLFGALFLAAWRKVRRRRHWNDDVNLDEQPRDMASSL